MTRFVSAAVAAVLITCTAAACSSSGSSPSAAGSPTSQSSDSGTATPTPSVHGSPTPTPSPTSTKLDPQLKSLLLTASDVGSSGVPVGVALLKGGNQVAGQTTLDACAGHFASESKRVARIQVAYIAEAGSGAGQEIASNEVVRYSPGGTTEAFSELQHVVATCPSRKQLSRNEYQTNFVKERPDLEWVHDEITTSFEFHVKGKPQWAAATYLFDGDLFDGVYVYGGTRQQALAFDRTLADTANQKLETAASGGPNAV